MRSGRGALANWHDSATGCDKSCCLQPAPCGYRISATGRVTSQNQPRSARQGPQDHYQAREQPTKTCQEWKEPRAIHAANGWAALADRTRRQIADELTEKQLRRPVDREIERDGAEAGHQADARAQQQPLAEIATGLEARACSSGPPVQRSHFERGPTAAGGRPAAAADRMAPERCPGMSERTMSL
jgi:hypothetical protein